MSVCVSRYSGDKVPIKGGLNERPSHFSEDAGVIYACGDSFSFFLIVLALV